MNKVKRKLQPGDKIQFVGDAVEVFKSHTSARFATGDWRGYSRVHEVSENEKTVFLIFDKIQYRISRRQVIKVKYNLKSYKIRFEALKEAVQKFADAKEVLRKQTHKEYNPDNFIKTSNELIATFNNLKNIK